MIFEYSKRKWQRGDAWVQLLHQRNRPIYTHGGYVFMVKDHYYRKQHDEDYWGWVAAKMALRSDEIVYEAPCPAPALCEVTYVWDVWHEPHDQSLACGFVAKELVRLHQLRPEERSAL